MSCAGDGHGSRPAPASWPTPTRRPSGVETEAKARAVLTALALARRGRPDERTRASGSFAPTAPRRSTSRSATAMVLGRGPSSDFPCPTPRSRAVTPSCAPVPTALEVVDLGSSNGTRINGNRMTHGHADHVRHDHVRSRHLPRSSRSMPRRTGCRRHHRPAGAGRLLARGIRPPRRALRGKLTFKPRATPTSPPGRPASSSSCSNCRSACPASSTSIACSRRSCTPRSRSSRSIGSRSCLPTPETGKLRDRDLAAAASGELPAAGGAALDRRHRGGRTSRGAVRQCRGRQPVQRAIDPAARACAAPCARR